MKINALILAGGQGSRMGGADKGLVLWQGRAFVDYVIDCIRPQVAHIAIVGDADFGQLRRGLCVFVLRGLGAATGFTNHVSHQYSKQAVGAQCLAPCLQFFLERPAGIGRAG